MALTNSKNSDEIKLKLKINTLIDRIQQMQVVLSEKNSKIKLLEEEIKMHRIEKKPAYIQEDSAVIIFITNFFHIAKMILEKEDFIKYSYETKNSEFFYKIEKNIFDSYISDYSSYDLKTFLDFCIDLSLVKSEKNHKCTYNSGDVKVYYVSKCFMNASVKK